MSFFFIVLMIVSVILTGITAKNRLDPVKRLQRSLSTPSQHLYIEYMALPKESRPFPDIGSILKALDEKNSDTSKELNEHFSYMKRGRNYNSPQVKVFDWNNNRSYCSHGRSRGSHNCPYNDYFRLHNSFEEVKVSIKAKDIAIRDSRLKGSLDMIDELEARLRDEVKVNQSFVKEFTQLP